MLNPYYDELIGKIEEYEGKKHSLGDDYIADIVLYKIKRIGIKKDITILINTDDKMPDDITLLYR